MISARRQLSLTVKPQDISQLDQAMDDATPALRIARRLRPRQADNFGLFTSETFLSLYRQATNGILPCWSASSLSLVVGGIVIMNIMLMVVTSDARNRPAEGARRAAFRHHGADAHGVGGAVGAPRIAGRRPGRDFRDRRIAFTPITVVEPRSVALGIGITAMGLFFGRIRQHGRELRSDRSTQERVNAPSLPVKSS